MIILARNCKQTRHSTRSSTVPILITSTTPVHQLRLGHQIWSKQTVSPMNCVKKARTNLSKTEKQNKPSSKKPWEHHSNEKQNYPETNSIKCATQQSLSNIKPH